MDQQYQNLENDFQLVFQQLKNISSLVGNKSRKKQSCIEFSMNSLNSNCFSEINNLLEYLDNSLMNKMEKIKDCITSHFRQPQKHLSFCHNVLNVQIQQKERKEQNSLNGIDALSIFQVYPPQKSDIHSNIFMDNLAQNKKLLNNQVKSAAAKVLYETNKKNQITKKLIQSDPQSTNLNKQSVLDKQIRGFQSPKIIFDTPLPKNKRIELFDIGMLQDKYTTQNNDTDEIQRNENIINKLKVNQQQQDQNQNKQVVYSGSFNDRMRVDNQQQQFFKRNDVNLFTEGQDSKQIFKFYDTQRFQSPNFNYLMQTKDDTSQDSKEHSRQQTQQTILSRQTQNVRDMSSSHVSKTMDLDVYSIKTREFDPVINGSERNDFTQYSEFDNNDNISTENNIFDKFNQYF